MIIKLNNYSHNIKGKLTVLQYLLDDKRVEEGEAFVIRGDVKFTDHLITGNKRKHTYVSGGLMFHKDDSVTVEQELEIMDSFEQMVFVGLDKSQYHIIWIKHVDKGRVELNFVISRTELSRGIDLDVYSHKRDKPLYTMWRNGINKKYGLADPNAESRKRTQEERMKMRNHRTKKGEFKNSFILTRANLDMKLAELVSTGVLQSKDEIIKYLKAEGFEITRNTKNSLSVKDESLGKKALRLQARPIYQDAFKSLSDLPEIEAAKVIDEPIKFNGNIYSKYLKTRLERHLKRYGQKKKAVTDDLRVSNEVTQPIASAKKENNDIHREITSGSEAETENSRTGSEAVAGGVELRERGLSSFYGADSEDNTMGDTESGEAGDITTANFNISEVIGRIGAFGVELQEYEKPLREYEQLITEKEEREHGERLFDTAREWIVAQFAGLREALDRVGRLAAARPVVSEDDRLIAELKADNKRARGELRELGSGSKQVLRE